MAQIIMNKKGIISVYEYKQDRLDASCVCRYDIIELPANIFSTEFIEKLKKAENPIELPTLTTN